MPRRPGRCWHASRVITSAAPSVLVVLAYAQLAVACLRLAAIDLATHRLPDRIVFPATGAGAVLFTGSAALSGEWATLLRAGLGAIVLFLFYLVLATASREGMGFGDVKLAGLLGLHLAWAGWNSLAVGAVAAFLLGGVFSLVLVVTRRATRTTRIPFGPWMIAGSLLGLACGRMLGGG